MSLSEPEAKFKLSLLNSNAIELDRLDTITQLTNMGLPQELITRLEDLWEKTKIISGQVVYIGKVILAEIMKFIKANPHLVAGVAIGAAVGALTSMIPFVGPLLAPLATVIATVLGGIAGYRLDISEKHREGVIGITQELIIVAKKFFELFANIINALQRTLAKG